MILAKHIPDLRRNVMTVNVITRDTREIVLVLCRITLDRLGVLGNVPPTMLQGGDWIRAWDFSKIF